MILTTLPEPGQLVAVRDRLFLVTDVRESEPTGDPVPQGSNGRTHVVNLLSLEEDTFGEVLEVIWEEESDANIREKPGLPDLSSKDDANGCSALVRALRWGVVDFIRRDMGEEEPETERGIENALLDGRLDLDTYWPKKEADEAGPLGRAVLAMIEDRLGLDTDPLGEKAEPDRGRLESGSKGQDHARRLKERLKESRTNIETTPSDLSSFVNYALAMAGQPPLEPLTLEGEPIDPEIWSEERVFRMPNLSGNWAKCAEGLEHPQTGEIRPITFDPEIAGIDRVLCHLSHPLVQTAGKLVRAQLLARGEKKILPGFLIGGVDMHSGGRLVIVHALLLVTGATGRLLHKELIRAGVEIRVGQGPPEVMSRQRLENVLSLGVDDAEVAEIRNWFQKRWAGPDGYETAIMDALDGEVETRMKSIQGTLMKRRKERLSDEIKPLRKLAEAIRKEIKARLEGQGGDSKNGGGEQEKDLAVRHTRLETLEAEANRGAREIKDHYRDFQTWLFPATMALREPRDIDHMF